MTTALTVAGSDPTGGAGIQADLETFVRFGVRGLSVVAALTAQGVGGVDEVIPVDGRVVAAQLDSVARGLQIDAVKVGMLLTREVVVALCAWLDRWRGGLVVVDPILRSGTGIGLLLPDALDAFRRDLLPRVALLTPNLDEAATLSGIPVEDLQSMEGAARRIHAMGARAVLVKGGHLAGRSAADLLFDGARTTICEEARVEVPGRIHGAGCALSSAIAARLALGAELPQAIRAAKRYVARAIAAGYTAGPSGPRFLDHSVETG